MISWIQNTFQRHFRVMFLLLLACVVISFIVVGVPGVVSHAQDVKGRKFFGLNLASRQDAERMQGDASISVELQFGYPILSGDQLQQYAMVRQACLHIADQLHVPAPTQSELQQNVQQLRMFAGDNGQFDAKRYNEFKASLKGNPRVKESDIARIVADNIRIERVQKLIAGPGLVLPNEVVRELEKSDTSWNIAVARLDRSSFQPTLSPTDAELTKFYEENNFRYTIPARQILTMADFPAAAFGASVNANDQELRSFFDANPARFAAQSEPGTTPAAPDFNQVREQVRQAYVQERGSRLATEAANRLALALYDKNLEVGSPEFNDAVKSAGGVVVDLPPFSPEALPAQLGNSSQTAEEAFRLSKNRRVSDPVMTDRGAAVLFFKGALEPEQPSFSAVRSRVLTDYTENERSKRFVAAGAMIRSQVQAAMKAGTSFANAVETAAAAQGIKVQVDTPAAFTLRQPPQGLNPAVFGILDSLAAQEVSAMTVAENTGVMVYASERKVPNLDQNNPNYAALRTQMAQRVANGNASEYLQDLIARELDDRQVTTR